MLWKKITFSFFNRSYKNQINVPFLMSKYKIRMTPSLIPPNISPQITDFPMNVLFSSKDEFIEKIDAIGRDAFVAQIAGNPEKYRSIRDPSRIRKKGDNDGVIYMLTNLVDLKIYVGKSNNFDQRIGEHLRGHGGAIYLENAVKAHGREKFVSVILLAGIGDKKELDLTEIAVIKHLGSLRPGGYNLHIGGKGGPHTAATRKKISESKKGKKYGPPSKETRAKIRAAKKGKKRPGISALQTGKKRGPQSEKHRAASSAAQLERYKRNPLSDKMRAILAAATQRAVIVTLETGEEIGFESCQAAANEMGTLGSSISNLANKKRKRVKCQRGKHLHAYFTARYRDTAPRTKRSGKPPSKETLAAMSKAVVITFETGATLHVDSVTAAAKAMGKCISSISQLVNKTNKKSKCKGGAYANQFFTARFSD